MFYHLKSFLYSVCIVEARNLASCVVPASFVRYCVGGVRALFHHVSSRPQFHSVTLKYAGGALSPNFTLRDSPRPTSCGFCSNAIRQWPIPVLTETGVAVYAC